MSFEYNIKTSKMDRRSENCLTVSHMFDSVIGLFVATFLVAYIYQFNGNIYDYIFNVGFFNIITYTTFLVVYGIVAYFVDKTNRVWFYRVGILLRAVLVIVIIFCGKELSQLLIVAGFVYGLSGAFYYSSYNVLKQEMVSRKNMRKYSVINHALAKVVEIVCPIVLGVLIDATTYLHVAIMVLVMCAIQIGTSLGIRAKRPQGSHFDLKGYIKKLKGNPIAGSKIKLLYLATMFYGFFTVITNVLNICIMMEFGSNLSLGTLTTIFSAASVLFMFIVSKFAKPGKRSWLLFVLALLPVVASIGIAITIKMPTIIVFNLSLALSSIVLRQIYDVYRNGTLKEAGFYSEICEHQTIIESIMNIARVLSFGTMILISLLRSLLAFQLMIVGCVMCFAVLGLLLVVYEYKFVREKTISQKDDEKQFIKIMKILKEQ